MPSAVEAESLLLHIGRTVRDQPATQKTGVTAILRIARRAPQVVTSARKALLMLPPDDLTIATPLLFTKDDPADVFSVLDTWQGQVTGAVKTAVENALKQRGGS